MNFKERIKSFFRLESKSSSPLIIIRHEISGSVSKDYTSVEDAIADLEKDPSVSAEKIEKLKESILKLKNKSVIRIKDGEIEKEI